MKKLSTLFISLFVIGASFSNNHAIGDENTGNKKSIFSFGVALPTALLSRFWHVQGGELEKEANFYRSNISFWDKQLKHAEGSYNNTPKLMHGLSDIYTTLAQETQVKKLQYAYDKCKAQVNILEASAVNMARRTIWAGYLSAGLFGYEVYKYNNKK